MRLNSIKPLQPNMVIKLPAKQIIANRGVVPVKPINKVNTQCKACCSSCSGCKGVAGFAGIVPEGVSARVLIPHPAGGNYNISLDSIKFDKGSNHFFWNGQDVTTLLTIQQKHTFPGFDEVRYNNEVSAKKYALTHGGQQQPATGSTNWLAVGTAETLKDLNPAQVGGKVNTLLNLALFGGLVYVGIKAVSK